MYRRSGFGFVFVLLLLVAVIGFSRRWFVVTTTRPPGNEVNVTLTVDPSKMQRDADTVKDKTKELAGQVSEEAGQVKQQLENTPPAGPVTAP